MSFCHKARVWQKDDISITKSKDRTIKWWSVLCYKLLPSCNYQHSGLIISTYMDWSVWVCGYQPALRYRVVTDWNTCTRYTPSVNNCNTYRTCSTDLGHLIDSHVRISRLKYNVASILPKAQHFVGAWGWPTPPKCCAFGNMGWGIASLWVGSHLMCV